MARFNTGNPVGSKDPRDLSDNAQNIDQWANSDSASFPDRLGVARRTLRGMDGEFQSFLDGSAYDFLGDYAAGIEVTARNQLIRAEGEFWRVAASTELPYTTTGLGMPEGGAFVAVGDAILRDDLAGANGLDLIGGTGTAAARNVGTGPEDVPLNSDLPQFGTAATRDVGTAPDNLPDVASFAVTESGVVPEMIGQGAIVDIIENSNGTAVRWESGLQVCFKEDNQNHPNSTEKGGVHVSENVTHEMPAEFAIIAQGGVFYETDETSGFWMTGVARQTIWRTQALRMQSFSTGNVGAYDLFAIGFWK